VKVADFHCQVCGHNFEAFYEPGEAVKCPDCDSALVQRMLSAPNVLTHVVPSQEKRKQRNKDRRAHLIEKDAVTPKRKAPQRVVHEL
jgi:putative FmdB family regulatory protein